MLSLKDKFEELRIRLGHGRPIDSMGTEPIYYLVFPVAEFEKRAASELEGVPWGDAHNQPLVANQIASRLAAEFYPRLFRSPDDFQNLALSVVKSELQRTQEMIDLIRRRSGKRNVLFIVDEVGHRQRELGVCRQHRRLRRSHRPLARARPLQAPA